jgi:putative transposase
MKTVEQTIRLRASQRKRLEGLLRDGELSPREQRRARVLLLSDSSWKKEAITEASGASRATIGRIRRRFREGGIDGAIGEGARSGSPVKITAAQQQRIVALVCSEPPDGSSRWTVRLLAEEAVRRGITKSIGRESVRVILRDHDMKPWREKNVVHS